MTEQEMQALRAMMKEVVSEELKPVKADVEGIKTEMQSEFKSVHQKLDHLTFQVDTLYKWVDGIDIDVKSLKKAQ